MKRLLSLFILVIYMASAIGVTYSLHYCSGKFKEICFTADTEKNCCGVQESDGCCTDKVTTVKCKDSHTPAGHTIVPIGIAEAVAALPAIIYHAYSFPPRELTHFIFKGPSPPLLCQGLPIYLRNRVIRV
jgi:hypothetical protein